MHYMPKYTEQLSVKIEAELSEMISEEIDASPYEPDKSDIVRTALRAYLEGNANRRPIALAD